jgi:signal peptidase I
MNNSHIDYSPISSWAKAKGFTHCFIFRGPSMAPTFRNGDLLYLRSAAHKLFLGDVVVYADYDKNEFIVHRIVSKSFEMLITRGDHNRLCDPPVTLGQIVGKVELIENKNGLKPVASGYKGLWLALIYRKVYWLNLMLRRVLWMPYQLVRISGFLSLIWKPRIVRIQLQSVNGMEVKYIYKQRIVASWSPARGKFYCIKPFDLVIPHPQG